MDAGHSNFFLINLDGSVTPSTAMAGLTSGGRPVDRQSLQEAMGLNPEQIIQFTKWIDLVQKRYRDLRWEKLVSLAPVLEIGAGKSEELGVLRLLYRKMVDRDGNLTAILVIGIDAGPNRAIMRQLEEERQRHKLEIRDVLALSANPPETLGSFLNDAGSRLEKVRNMWDTFQVEQLKLGNSLPAIWKSESTEAPGQRLFRELHMIKGNAGAFGFDGLAANAQECENLLEALKVPAPGSERVMVRLASSLSELRTHLEEIGRALKLIAGEGQDAMARILKWKLDRLLAATAEIDRTRLDPPMLALINTTLRLPFLSPAYLARKYKNLVERIAMNLRKHVEFRVTSNTGDIHPECFSRVDEALVHILRNMVDHGIETMAEREALGKGDAEIGMEYVTEEDRVYIRIRDDGRGMDPNAIVERGIRMGLLTLTEANALDDTGKLGLIFKEGFTTRESATLISGRGLGLSLAARCVTDQGGNIYVYSQPGQGARFAIELPHIGKKNLPQTESPR